MSRGIGAGRRVLSLTQRLIQGHLRARRTWAMLWVLWCAQGVVCYAVALDRHAISSATATTRTFLVMAALSGGLSLLYCALSPWWIPSVRAHDPFGRLVHQLGFRASEQIAALFLGYMGLGVSLSLASGYVFVLIGWHGRVEWSHLVLGYITVWVVMACGMSLGLWCSTFAKTRVASGLCGVGVAAISFGLSPVLSRTLWPPLSDVFGRLDLYHNALLPALSGQVVWVDALFVALLSVGLLFATWCRLRWRE